MSEDRSGNVVAMPQPAAYWPPEDDAGVMPAEITAEHRRELPPCRPGWHAPAADGETCQVCARPLEARDMPYRLEVPPGGVAGLLRVLGEGARAIGKAARSESTVDDLAVGASVMAALLREQKARG